MNSRAVDGRWDSKFGQFVSRFGAEALADEVGVDRTAVYHWVRGASSPRATVALEIQAVARANGFSISLDDVFRAPRESSAARRKKAETL